MSTFEAGKRVAWHHEYATQFASEAVVRAEAVPQLPEGHPSKDNPGTGQFGTIVGPANERGTLWSVLLDGATESRILTSDELVRIAEEQTVNDE